MAGKPIVPKEHHEAILIAYAKTMLTWQFVEDNLYFLFSSLVLSSASYPVASAVFHSIVNFQSRLATVDEAAKMAFRENGKLGRWQELHKRALQLSGYRNKLAHSTLHLHRNKRGQESLRLGPSAFDVRDDVESRYTLGMVEGWRKEIRSFLLDLVDFNTEVGALLPAHREMYRVAK